MSMATKTFVQSSSNVANIAYGVANVILQLDASDTANVSRDSSNNVIWWKNASNWATNAYFKPGVLTANGFPTWYSGGSYPYIYFFNTTNTLSSTSQGLGCNVTITGMAPYSMGKTVYIVSQTTNTFGIMNQFRINSPSTNPTDWTIFQLAGCTSGELYVGSYYNDAPNYQLTYTTLLPINTKSIYVYTAGYSNGAYFYANNNLWASNTTVYTPLYGSNVCSYTQAHVGAGADNRNWTGYMNEIVWYGTYHDKYTRRAVTANLVTKWNVANTLPAGTSWTVTGSPVISTAQYKTGMFSTSSLYLPGSTGNRTVATGYNPASLSLYNWTIELFVYVPSGWTGPGANGTGAPFCFANSQPSYRIYPEFQSTGTRINWYFANSAGQFGSFLSNSYVTGWNHLAYCYNVANNNLQSYLNGQRANATTSVCSIITTNLGPELATIVFGTFPAGGSYVAVGAGGLYVDAMRISKTLRYTGDSYTVPTAYYPIDNFTSYINFFEGSNSSTTMSNAEYYYDQSYSAPVSWSVSGSAVISTTQALSAMSNTASLYLPGNVSNRAEMSSFPASSDLSGSWTIEYFIYIPTAFVGGTELAGRLFSATVCFANTGKYYRVYNEVCSSYKSIQFWSANSTGGAAYNGVYSSNAYTEGAWNHLAWCYNSSNNNYQIFLNGFAANATSSLSSVISTNLGTDLTNWGFGVLYATGTTNYGANGLFVDAVRVSSNVRYSGSTYTVPTTYLPADSNTTYINFFEGTNNSTTMNVAEYYFKN